MARYIARQWRALPLILALATIGPLFTSLAPWPLKVLIDKALAGGGVAGGESMLDRIALPSDPKKLILVAAGASVVLYVLGSLLEAASTWTWSVVGQRMVRELARDLFAKLQRLKPTFHQRHTVGDLLSRITGDAWAVYTLVDGLVLTPWQNVATLVWVGVLAWLLDWRLTLLSLAVAPMLALAARTFGARIKQRAKQGRQNESKLYSLVHQTLSAIPIVQAFGSQDRNQQQFAMLADSAVLISQRQSLLKNSYALVTGLVTTCGVAIVLYFGAKRVMAGTMTIGSLLVFVAYLKSMQSAATGLLATHGTLKGIEVSVERVVTILSSDEEIVERPGAQALAWSSGEGLPVRFENVTFGYDRAQPVLREIDVDVGAGETVAVVGPTGAGKSTMLSLLSRLYDPDEGRLLIGGKDLREVRLADVRRAVAVVPQEPVLLPVSVAENIGYGHIDVTRQEIERAARAAHAAEFIERMPQGYDTIIGERGATLSAGQRQRIAIARAILRDSAVLVLDEPSSALDAESERLVMDALRRLCEGRTCFIIAHRLWTVRDVDRVIRLDHGRLAERAEGVLAS